MKLHAEMKGERYQLDLRRDGARAFANIDGREYEIELTELEPGLFLIRHDNKIYEAAVTRYGDGTTNVSLNGRDHQLMLHDPKRLRGSGSSDEQADGVAEIKTAMPGKVVKILTVSGTRVEKGDSILVVEAMKMQNELKSPKAGAVKDIRVAEGSTVAAGDVLATVE
jgi:biotin carboxyl carrier protein